MYVNIKKALEKYTDEDILRLNEQNTIAAAVQNNRPIKKKN
jgi:hypothetical protein